MFGSSNLLCGEIMKKSGLRRPTKNWKSPVWMLLRSSSSKCRLWHLRWTWQSSPLCGLGETRFWTARCRSVTWRRSLLMWHKFWCRLWCWRWCFCKVPERSLLRNESARRWTRKLIWRTRRQLIRKAWSGKEKSSFVMFLSVIIKRIMKKRWTISVSPSNPDRRSALSVPPVPARRRSCRWFPDSMMWTKGRCLWTVWTLRIIPWKICVTAWAWFFRKTCCFPERFWKICDGETNMPGRRKFRKRPLRHRRMPLSASFRKDMKRSLGRAAWMFREARNSGSASRGLCWKSRRFWFSMTAPVRSIRRRKPK